MCAGSAVAIVGGGNSAGQAAVFLSRKVRQVTLMVRGPDLSRTMSRYLIDQIDRIDNVYVRTGTEVDELLGERSLEGLMLRNGNGDGPTRLDVRALFVFIGADPRTGWLTDEVLLDNKGFVLTGAELAAASDTGGAQPLARAQWRCGWSISISLRTRNRAAPGGAALRAERPPPDSVVSRGRARSARSRTRALPPVRGHAARAS